MFVNGYCSHAGHLLQHNGDLVKQVRTPPVRPADGVVGCVYESFVPGVLHRWMEMEILPTSSGGEGENDIRKDVRPRDDSS